MRKKLLQILHQTVQRCFEEGKLREAGLPDFVMEVPANPNHGHFATNLAMGLASSQKRPPREIAGIIAGHLKDDEGLVEKVEVAGPGFINFTVRREEWRRSLARIIASGKDYGRSDIGAGRRILVEYVSANPTGPLHLGHGRGAALGDTLCRILSFTGHEVIREFYVNDAGQQVRLLGESVYSRWRQSSDKEYPFPENGYHGDYIVELAKEISAELDLGGVDRERAIELCAERGRERMLAESRKDLEEFRVEFDVWFKESELFSEGRIEESLKTLEKEGHLYEEDGALWIRTSAFGDDKDRVLRKKDGQFTYFASDIAYHLQKWERGFARAVNLWGADHHGYIERVKAALKSRGIQEEWLTVLLLQLVKLWKGGQEIKMSKRSGQYVTLKELMEEVGVDAVRFVFLTKNHDSPLDFDIDLVKRQDSDNPVYYVQYAHARISSIFRKASSMGVSLPSVPEEVLEQLTLEEEMDLIRMMAEFPALLEDIARTLEPHRLTYYLKDLAALFHKYFNLGTKTAECRIVTEETGLSQARLVLADAVRIVLCNGLRLLAIDAPERM